MPEGVHPKRGGLERVLSGHVQKVPLGRFGDSKSDVTPIVVFLLSDDSRYLTGQTLMADGGANKVY